MSKSQKKEDQGREEGERCQRTAVSFKGTRIFPDECELSSSTKKEMKAVTSMELTGEKVFPVSGGKSYSGNRPWHQHWVSPIPDTANAQGAQGRDRKGR